MTGLVEASGETSKGIPYNGMILDRTQLFAPTPQIVAERLAFPGDWQAANLRLGSFMELYKYRDFTPGTSVWMRKQPINPIKQGEMLVFALEAGRDFETETTLEQAAALVARHPKFLQRHGLTGDKIMYAILISAADAEIDYTKEWVKSSHGAKHYSMQALGLRLIAKGLASLASAVSLNS